MSADIIARGLASRAAAAARSDNTRSLIAALRNWGCLPAPQHRLNAADIPVVTLGAAGAASTLNAQTAGVATVARLDSRLGYVAGPVRVAGTVFPLNGYVVSRGGFHGANNALGDPLYSSLHHAFEFLHTGDRFELPITGHGAAAPYNLRLLVDDAIAATHAAPAGTGSQYFLKFVFGSVRARRIRVETFGIPTNGVNAVTAGEVAATGRSYPLVTILGDSFIDATGAGFPANGEGSLLARLLGLRGAPMGVGGTGMINSGGNNSSGFPKVNFADAARMTDLTMAGVIDAQTGSGLPPALGIVMASINDGSAGGFASVAGASSYQDAIQRQSLKLIDAWKAANPGKPLVLFGPTWTNATPVLDIFRTRDGVQQACFAAGGPGANLWFIDRLGPSTLLRSGAVDALNTTGTTTAVSATLTALASTAGVVVGSAVSGPGIPDGAVVLSVVSASSVTLSHACTAAGTAVAIQFRNSQAALYTSLVSGDVTHPSPGGHELDALWMARELRRLILTEFP